MPAFHHVVRWLHLRQLAAAWLHRFPKVHRLSDSQSVYRVRHIESMLLSDELFTRNVYLKAIDSKTVTTFADLGCNVGMVAVLLRHLTGGKQLEGLMVDANPEMVEETNWHLQQNQMGKVKALYGLVGAEKTGQNAEFYILPSNLGSSQYPVYEPGKPPKGDWKKTVVPQLSLEQEWLKNVGDKRCHLLKIDIEGSEGKLIQNEQAFLRRVDTIIIEWHKWIVTKESLDAMLSAQGFRLVEVLEDLDNTGIAWYRRPA